MLKRHSSKITAVVLAAGLSRRMGQPKQLLPWGETTILGETLRQVQGAAVDEWLLVSGAFRAEVEGVAAEAGVPVVFNPDFATGEILSSLQTAVRSFGTQRPAAVLVVLGDLPFLTTALHNQVIQAFHDGLGEIVVPVFNGRRGHPVLIGAALFDELLRLPPTAMPRDLLRQQPQHIYELPVETDVILRDIDTPEAYQKWLVESD